MNVGHALPPVVTYKKSKATKKNVPAPYNSPGPGAGQEAKEEEDELSSAQFGITDPGDEGKAAAAAGADAEAATG